MFGALPKLFDRSFFIGFFLPASLMFLGAIGTLIAFDCLNSEVKNFLAEKSTFGAALSIVIVWLVSILLMALNRPLIRLFEGYGWLNPFRIFLSFKKRHFKNQIAPLFTKLDEIVGARRTGGVEPHQEDNFGIDLWKAVNAYPEIIENVLSTRLGNVMRSYERYPDVVYGMEAIVLWPRLFMIIPEETKNRVHESESLFHFSLNLLVSGFVNLMIYGFMVAVYWEGGNATRLSGALLWPIIPAISALSAWFGWWQLPSAAGQRGEQVKAVFDLYRGMLAEALGLELPSTQQAERNMWELVSRRMMYRLSEDVKSLDEFRKKDYTKRSDEKANARARSQPSEGKEGIEGNESGGDNDRSEQIDGEKKNKITMSRASDIE